MFKKKMSAYVYEYVKCQKHVKYLTFNVKTTEQVRMRGIQNIMEETFLNVDILLSICAVNETERKSTKCKITWIGIKIEVEGCKL